MTGEKLPPLVIGKCQKPRCFNRVDPNTLPVVYKFNKKAWMTSYIMEEWLKSLNRKMVCQKRKILLFLDNAPSHQKINLSNIKLQFFPANTTSKLQPMDQGITQCLKLKFRKRQLKKMVQEMDHSSKCGSEILKKNSLLDAIYWIDRSWKEVETPTIVKCFKNCVFFDKQIAACMPTSEVNVDDDDDDDEDDDVPLAVLQLSREIFGCEFLELTRIDACVETCDNREQDWDKPASEIIEEMNEEEEEEQEEEESEEYESVICRQKFCEHVEEMKMYASVHGHDKILEKLVHIDEMMTEDYIKCKSGVQTKISDFFKN
ncbi:tigger transposable element-derived protein 4-like [Saccostrea echinata]|uniref:tigger transposable element-derived protein 4-like n=1 Tax=Saccostrea echinata TaxID=191078 RepID=UPI002A80E42E|nr:tigger transposable element-derived protein 4-like [Saccostrea echinata]